MSGGEGGQQDPESEFLRIVTAALQPLTSTGLLNFEASRYDEKFFGNAFVTLRGRNIRVRFVRDRDLDFVEVVCLNRGEGWQPIERVLSAVGVAGPPAEGTIGIDAAADLLIRNFNTIEMRICTDETARKLAALEAAATRQVLEALKSSV
jgi:hypothetical protein